ncbi:hypothetical protein [Acidihalobacter prosperus]
MTDHILYFLAALVFLPVFPLSSLFVYLVGHVVSSALLRAIAFLGWPLIGLILLNHAQYAPDWIQIWALGTAILYAFRMLTTRELRLWNAYLGISLFALLWLSKVEMVAHWQNIITISLALAIPLGLSSVLCEILENRFGASYYGLYGGLQLHQPRLAGILTLVTLASIATPIFPSFFVLLGVIFNTQMPFAVAILFIWVLWSWAAISLIQGFMLGRKQSTPVPADMNQAEFYSFGLIATLLVVVGLIFIATLLQGV